MSLALFYKCMGPSGPTGNPNRYQMITRIIQKMPKNSVYGNRADMSVPKPILLSYFLAKDNNSTRYGSIGVIGFVIESPTR